MSHADIEDLYPLSPMQEGMLFHTLFDPESQLYFRQLSCRVEGELDVTALRQALQGMVEKHPILRTGFLSEGVDEPLQVVYGSAELPFVVEDWRSRTDADQEASFPAYVEANRRRGFDLEIPPLMRVSLVRTGERSYRLIWSYHHLLLDGWSLALLLQELFACWGSLSAGQEPPVFRRRPYRDYIAWLKKKDLGASESFWRRALDGFTEPVPLGGAERAAFGFHGVDSNGEERIDLGPAASEALQSFARRHGLTLNTLLQGVWALLLSRYSGETDIVFGATVSGRPTELAGFEEMIGLFINTIPVRLEVSPGAAVVGWLKALQEAQAEARQHEHCPLTRVQGWSMVPRGVSLFESILSVQNQPAGSPGEEGDGGRGLRATDLEHPDASNYPLTLIGVPGPQLQLRLLYATSRFTATDARRRLAHLETLLLGLVQDDGRRLGDLPFLSPAERRQILVDWNDRAREYPRERCIHDLFAEVTAAAPDRVAVVAGGQSLTYGELNRRANQLACHLQGFGLGPDSRVGLFAERSLEIVIGLLGILKAGAVYVPLNPGDPSDRLALLTAEADIMVVVAQKALLDELPPGVGQILVSLDDPMLELEPAADLPVRAVPDNLAYIVFTSGSTGRPKGVAVSHRSVVRLVRGNDYACLDESEVLLQLASVAFDASTFEIWGSLLNGGLLVVMPPGTPSLEELGRVLTEERVTTLFLTTSLFNVMVDRQIEDLRGLRQLLFGGDVVSPARVRKALDELEGCELIHCYGPTESTTFATCISLRLPVEQEGPISIGRPIANTTAYVVNRWLELLPAGVAGELCLGGDGLARGYQGQPDRTAEKLIPCPFAQVPGERLYRTGDLVRWFEDGRIEFLGRFDHQVKIRGFRVEPGEIEAVLGQHSQLRQAVVMAHADASGEKRLVAYVVAASETLPSVEDLRRYLEERVPAYMIPAAFRFLGALPLNANGKVDRRKLTGPGTSRPDLEGSFVPPRTAEEKALAEIWREVLGIEAVGVEDNFFTLGGDSIRSIEVLSRAEQKKIRFSLQQLFDHPTISGLLQELRQASAEAAAEEERAEPEPAASVPFSLVPEADRPKLRPGLEDAYPLASLQAGMIFHSELDRSSSMYVDLLSYHLRAPYDPSALQAALRQIVERHPVLRTSFDLDSYSEPLQLVHPAAEVEVPFHLEDLRPLAPEAQDERLRAWFETDALAPFDYARAPLFRFHLHRRSEDTYQISLVLHHCILDGWSAALLLTEIFKSYFQILGRAAEDLSPPPALGYREFVALELEARGSEETRRFWERKIDEAQPTLLPRWPQSEPPAATSEEVQLVIPGDLFEPLRRLAAEVGAPLKSVLLGTHLRALAALTGQTSVTTGLVTSGRPEGKDGERIAGLFLNTLPLAARLSGGTWRDLVRETFEAEREISRHRRFPFAELGRKLKGRPLFEANFNFVHFHIYEAVQRELDCEVLGGASHAETNFPLAVNVQLDEASGQALVGLIYHPRELPAAQVEAIREVYLRVLTAMAADREVRYDLVALLPEQERQILADWNRTAHSYPAELTNELRLEELVARQAERTPDSTAVVFGEERLTYRELDARANRLARFLVRVGVGVETPVGICLDRSLEMVVAILGVLRAGGAYVPLDPSLPFGRLRFMAQEVGARVVLTVEELLPILPESGDVRVVCLDRDWLAIAAGSGAPPATGATASQLAYILFTSGSTGLPKAVMVTHWAIGNRILWMQRDVPLDASDSVLLKTPFSFDASIWELFLPLLIGATLVVARPGSHQDPGALLLEVERGGVTVLQLVPSLLPGILEHPRAASLAGLRRLFCGGEALPADFVDRFLGRFGATVSNLYGPTETAIDAASWPCQAGVVTGVVPIGKPIANLRVHIVDPWLHEAPIGTTGELYVGGVGLARGYFGKPDLTAEKFVPDPFGSEPGGRLYRTGDLARWRPDGLLEFRGRIDHQVKVRGVRIEPAEIEALLRRHPAVREAVILARLDLAGDLRLIAYVVAGGEAGPAASLDSELRAHLRGFLPETMLPAAIVHLAALPLAPNGKLDRSALPAPDWAKRTATAEFLAPRTPIEESLAGIWSEVLGVRDVGVHDSFFELGGHSLLALPIIARVRKTFGVDLPLAALFAEPTIERLAVSIAELLVERIEELPEDEVARLLQSIEGGSLQASAGQS
jgi:amino acid adenylation domain-containing protein